MKFAIALLRVSSDRQYQEGYGIEVQKSRCEYRAEREGLTIVRFFVEHFTGRVTNRQTLEDIFNFVKEHDNDISALIFADIDRATRGGVEVYLYLKKKMRQFGVEFIDASGIIQKPINTLAHLGEEYEWSVRSPSRLTEVIMAEQASAEATQILTRCIGGQITCAKAGYQFRMADYGFRNKRLVTEGSKKYNVLIKHPKEAHFVEAMFRLRAAGTLSDEAICQRVNAMGYGAWSGINLNHFHAM